MQNINPMLHINMSIKYFVLFLIGQGNLFKVNKQIN